jgi:hypothetical protein
VEGDLKGLVRNSDFIASIAGRENARVVLERVDARKN